MTCGLWTAPCFGAGAGGTTAGRRRRGAPLLDVGAEDHATWEVRLFAS